MVGERGPTRRLEQLILLRLACVQAEGIVRSRLLESLAGSVEDTSPVLPIRVDPTLHRLIDRGHVEVVGRQFLPTATGRHRVAAPSGLGDTRPGWAIGRALHLPLMILELGGRAPDEVKPIATGEGLRTALIARAIGRKPLAELTRADLVADLVWRRLREVELPTPALETDVGTGALVDWVLSSYLEDERPETRSRALGLIAARIVGATSAHPDHLRRALTDRWLAERPLTSLPQRAGSSLPMSPSRRALERRTQKARPRDVLSRLLERKRATS